MDQREFKRKMEEQRKAREQMLQDKGTYDRKMHSEKKSWEADYTTGSLKFNKEE